MKRPEGEQPIPHWQESARDAASALVGLVAIGKKTPPEQVEMLSSYLALLTGTCLIAVGEDAEAAMANPAAEEVTAAVLKALAGKPYYTALSALSYTLHVLAEAMFEEQ